MELSCATDQVMSSIPLAFVMFMEHEIVLPVNIRPAEPTSLTGNFMIGYPADDVSNATEKGVPPKSW